MHTKCDITTDKMPGRYLGRPSKIDRSHSSEWISNKFNVAHMLRTVIALIIYCNDLRIMRQNMFSHRNGQCNILKNKQFTCQKSFQCSAEWNWPRVPRIFLFFSSYHFEANLWLLRMFHFDSYAEFLFIVFTFCRLREDMIDFDWVSVIYILSHFIYHHIWKYNSSSIHSNTSNN